MPEPKIETVLAFDFGLKRIGVAVGQSLTKTAEPLPLLNAENGAPKWALIQQLIDEWHPTLLIVGLPVHMDGTEQEVTQYAKRFGNRLNGRFHLPVKWADERLSSYEAELMLKDLKQSPSHEKINVDSLSAVIILEQYFQNPF